MEFILALLNCHLLGELPGPGFLPQDGLYYGTDMRTCPRLYLISPAPVFGLSSLGLICGHFWEVFLPQNGGRSIQIVSFKILEIRSEPQTLDLRPRLR